MVESLSEHASLLLDSFGGDGRVSDEGAFEAVYDDLRRLAGYLMARQPPGHSFRGTELVNEAYLKLVGNGNVNWDDQRHLVNTVAQAMRQVLVDRARRRGAIKRGGGQQRVDLSSIDPGTAHEIPADHERLDDAVQSLEAANARWGEIVRLRFYAGLTIEQTAQLMEISEALVSKDWRFARA